jgi:hypothetical protein
MKFSFKRWVEDAAQHPDILYHAADPANRNSIQQQGLLLRYSVAFQYDDEGGGGIFLTDTPPRESDVWEVDARGLNIEPDDTTEPFEGETWWVCFEDIPPSRLRLL